jgi:CDP-glycerol glycerophosphotransferase (TagB/SpsB family)
MSKDRKKLYSKSAYILNFMLDKINILFPKNKRIWIYGAWLGQKYSDNSKYLFEYATKHYPEIDHYWISQNKEVVEDLKNKGYKSLYAYSIKSIFIQLRAGLVFYTNSLFDISDYHFCSRAYKVALWHGMPLKKLYLDDNRRYKNHSNIKKRLSNLKYKLYSDVKRDLSIATSESAKETIRSAFDLSYESILIVGQPRNDIFNKFSNKSEVLKLKDNTLSQRKIITYMPTYRDDEENREKFHGLLEDILKDPEVDKLLQKHNYHMLVKFHFLGGNANINGKNITFISDNDITDTQELLNITDILITDYSSCFIDYLLKRSPLMFVANDVEGYEEKENGFYYDYREITKGILAEDKEQFKVLLEKLILDDASLNMNEKYTSLNKLFNEVIGENYSENLCKEINRRLNLTNR